MSSALPPSSNHFGLGYVQRGDAAMAQGEYRQAAGDYCRAVSLDAADAGVYARLGEAFAAIGDLAQAAKAFEAAVHLAPEDVPVRARVAAACDAAGLAFPSTTDASALKGFTPPPRQVGAGVTPTLGQVGPRLPGVAPTLGEVKDLKATAAPPPERGHLAKDGFGTTSRTADLLAQFREPGAPPAPSKLDEIRKKTGKLKE